MISKKIRNKAFTLIELLVVIAIIALLLSIVMPALRTAKEQARKNVCANEIKQQSMALLMYAQENEEMMPTMTWSGGEWLWDVSYFTTDVIVASGAHKKVFHCSSNHIDTGENEYWRYSEYFIYGIDVDTTPEPTSIEDRQWHWRVISYCYMTETNDGRGDIWAPSEPGAPKVPSASKEFIAQTTQTRSPSGQLELIVDSVIEYPGTGFILPDNSGWAMGTNHMGRRGDPIEPSGGNIGFLDGHVTWRHFEDMYQRYEIQGVIFWW
jgi:prepilin-type N-terminal cleavage/methylation domain-containing protein/prepilin-type processing-associated H-X9-DG protein